MAAMVQTLALDWFQRISAISLQFAAAVIALLLIENTLGRRLSAATLRTLWLLAFARLALPAPLFPDLSTIIQVPDSLKTLLSRTGPLVAVVAASVWLAGIVFWISMALGRFQRTWQKWVLAEHDHRVQRDCQPLADACARRLGLVRKPPTLVRSGSFSPFVLGFFRPVVIIPSSLFAGKGRRDRIEHVLLHEYAHIRRGDPLVSLTTTVLQILFWFHPLIGLARRRVIFWTEVGCDQRVCCTLGRRWSRYRRTLLELAQPTTASLRATLSFLPRQSHVRRRCERLQQRYALNHRTPSK